MPSEPNMGIFCELCWEEFSGDDPEAHREIFDCCPRCARELRGQEDG